MQTYTRISYELSRILTMRYSTSFGLSSRLFHRRIRPHIYAIYGLVRIADEIVDTYSGPGQRALLDKLEAETYASLTRGYSTNPIVQSFATTCQAYGIDRSLIEPFFASMRMDIGNAYRQADYARYIYGSAEVVGLMCLRVFCEGNTELYETQKTSARALGAAYQKVNFLRDIAADFHTLGRSYIPDSNPAAFTDADRDRVIADIQTDLQRAKQGIVTLPLSCRLAVMTSYALYAALLDKLAHTPASVIATQRVRLSTYRKLYLLLRTTITRSIA